MCDLREDVMHRRLEFRSGRVSMEALAITSRQNTCKGKLPGTDKELDKRVTT
jgi:hypothetical protein